MSYCRFSDPSDVYVFGSNQQLECFASSGGGSGSKAKWYHPTLYSAHTYNDMIEHLLEHRRRGDLVPQHAIDRLLNEMEDIPVIRYDGRTPYR